MVLRPGGAGRGGSSTSIALKGKNVRKTGTVIGLYMPPAVNVSYNMDYSEGEVGVSNRGSCRII